MKKKPIIGILGGIASGKSTVAAEFAKLGCKVIDADKIAHALLENPDIKNAILTRFSPDILDPKNQIDHKKLAEVVFADPDKLSSLNSILHPPVLAEVEKLIEQYNRQSQVKAIVLDMPLLIEVGWHKRCDTLIFIDCKRQVRLKRAKKAGINEKQLKKRENFQISLDNKVTLSDNTINNDLGLAELFEQIANLFSYLMGS